MEQILKEERFNIISKENKIFIEEFTKQMETIGYGIGDSIGDGFCWGHYMIIYSQNNVKAKKIIARIYIRDKGIRIWGGKNHKWDNEIVLRLFFTNIDKHMNYIETAPSHIKLPFINNEKLCKKCEEKQCHNKKIYTVNGKIIEKCGYVFEFKNPKVENVMDYIDILKEFYVNKKKK